MGTLATIRAVSSRLPALAVVWLAGPAQAAQSYGVTVAPIARSQAAPQRKALIVAPGALSGPTAARNAVAQADASRYRDLLRLLGFEVTTITGETRLGLDLGFKAFAATLAATSAGADVAILVLGTARPKGDALYVFPEGDAPPPEAYETEGLRLARLLETIAARGPKETVVLVDECRDGDGATCRGAAAHLPDGVSAIVASRRPADASGAPVAGLASLGTEMLPLMRREGLAYLDLYGELAQRVAGTNMSVAASPSLTRGFAFLPTGFLAQLDEACNRVDPDAGADALRQGVPVAPLVPACERAARTWAFADHFKTRLAAAREEAAFQHAVTGCDAAAMGGFLSTYGGSRLAPAVSEARAACEAQQREAREREAQQREARETPPPAPPAPAPPRDNGLTCTVGGLDPNGDNWLALRHGPSPQAAWSSTHMGPGTTVTAFARLGPWLRVRLPSGEEGWASRHFLSCGSEPPLPPTGAAGGTCAVAGLDPAGNNWLALRAQPSFQAAWSATQMGPGTQLTPLERSGGWLHVRLRSGETGWANARFVRCGG